MFKTKWSHVKHVNVKHIWTQYSRTSTTVMESLDMILAAGHGGWVGSEVLGLWRHNIYLNPGESRKPWKSWLTLCRKSATNYSQTKPPLLAMSLETQLNHNWFPLNPQYQKIGPGSPTKVKTIKNLVKAKTYWLSIGVVVGSFPSDFSK